MRKIDQVISDLIAYAKTHLHLLEEDTMYALNSILELLNLESVEIVPPENSFEKPDALLEELVAYALQEKRIEEWEQERLCDQVMGLLSLRPSEVQKEFDKRYAVGAKEATDWFYGYCVYNYYVKRARLDKNPRFDVNGLTVTINKSKPEFRDPNKAKAGNSVKGGYPKCVICRENEGYAPRDKRTLRAVSMTLGGENFFWQYSPYGYFHEHGIAVNCTHTPMYVDKSTFYKLMDFVDLFPHYFIGCNAPLPRIGGSVLAHDHYQGGGEILPLHKAKIKTYLQMEGYDSVKIGILDWPGTVLRIVGEDRDAIAEVGDKIRLAWNVYSNPALQIVAEDENGVHNAISPTVIKQGGRYEMNIILRSNITNSQYPDGIFHAHPEYHMIKKESIGLIEAQGLFILPGRLEAQLAEVEKCIANGQLSEDLQEFALVYEEVKAMGGDIHEGMQRELGSICQRILENTAVFTDEQFIEFLKGVGCHE
ncbi:MAG: UDP-glucose--hexose-1-phosphate uridylyltransferase [Clostridia bacterium]|nr:UDP-glucose--hexose-1-phosphate uridylyltransferase [Clostridia bacterium]